jgi:GNAT superfamily N-acetyltransferase
VNGIRESSENRPPGDPGARPKGQLPHDVPVPDLAELVIVWAHGWAVSRGTPPPAAITGGLKIDIDRPRNIARYVLNAGDWRSVAVLGCGLTVSGTEIKVAGAAACLRRALTSNWTMYDPNHLMTATFTREVAEVPPSWTARIVDDGGALVGVVRDSAGDVVSSARLAACGEYGVIDRVRTRPADRRRGMGRAVMTMLGNRALDDGLTTGLLSATADGQALYSALGWAIRGELAGAFRS